MRSPDVQSERAGGEFKGVLSVSADSSLGSKQNISWGWVRREGATKHYLFLITGKHWSEEKAAQRVSGCWLQVGTKMRSSEPRRLKCQTWCLFGSADCQLMWNALHLCALLEVIQVSSIQPEFINRTLTWRPTKQQQIQQKRAGISDVRHKLWW